MCSPNVYTNFIHEWRSIYDVSIEYRWYIWMRGGIANIHSENRHHLNVATHFCWISFGYAKRKKYLKLCIAYIFNIWTDNIWQYNWVRAIFKSWFGPYKDLSYLPTKIIKEIILHFSNKLYRQWQSKNWILVPVGLQLLRSKNSCGLNEWLYPVNQSHQ